MSGLSVLPDIREFNFAILDSSRNFIRHFLCAVSLQKFRIYQPKSQSESVHSSSPRLSMKAGENDFAPYAMSSLNTSGNRRLTSISPLLNTPGD